MILAVSEYPCCQKPSIKFLLKRIYGLEDDDVCSVLSNGMILAISEPLFCRKPSINFLLTRIYGWKMLFEEFHDGCLMLGLWHLYGMISDFLCILSVCCLQWNFCSRGNIVSKTMFEEFRRWLFSARQSLICKWDVLINFILVFMLPDASHQVSAWGNILFGRDVWRIQKTAV